MKRKFNYDVPSTNYAGLTIQLDQAVVVWSLKKDAWVLAHECVHAANMTFERVGIHASHTNDEALAYLVGSLMRNAMKGKKR